MWRTLQLQLLSRLGWNRPANAERFQRHDERFRGSREEDAKLAACLLAGRRAGLEAEESFKGV